MFQHWRASKPLKKLCTLQALRRAGWTGNFLAIFWRFFGDFGQIGRGAPENAKTTPLPYLLHRYNSKHYAPPPTLFCLSPTLFCLTTLPHHLVFVIKSDRKIFFGKSMRIYYKLIKKTLDYCLNTA